MEAGALRMEIKMKSWQSFRIWPEICMEAHLCQK